MGGQCLNTGERENCAEDFTCGVKGHTAELNENRLRPRVGPCLLTKESRSDAYLLSLSTVLSGYEVRLVL